MTLPEYFKNIVETACMGFHWYYDVKAMQNITADNAAFPAAWMEEYYAERSIDRYGRIREATFEIHFQDLVAFEGVALEREQVRERLMQEGVIPFVEAYNYYAQREGWGEIGDYTCDPEPPMFDANTTGRLLRFTVRIPECFTIPHDFNFDFNQDFDAPPYPPTPDPDAVSESEQTNENEQSDEV